MTVSSPTFSFAADNEGINGATTANWAILGGGKPLSNALIFITRYGITNVAIMLGTNDAKPFNDVSSTTYHDNLQFVITTLESNGVTKIVLNQPPYIQASGSGLPDPTSANALLVLYQGSLAALAASDPTHVFLGDRTAYADFQANASWYQADGIHPNDTGATQLAHRWAAAYPR